MKTRLNGIHSGFDTECLDSEIGNKAKFISSIMIHIQTYRFAVAGISLNIIYNV
jgi:hypothetical protein